MKAFFEEIETERDKGQPVFGFFVFSVYFAFDENALGFGDKGSLHVFLLRKGDARSFSIFPSPR